MTIEYGVPRPYNKRGVCSVCGRDAYDGRATKCDEHRVTKPKAVRRDDDLITFVLPNAGAAGPGGDKPSETVKDVPPTILTGKSLRAEALSRQIKEQVNPQLIKGFALTCRPVPEHNFFIINGNSIELTPLGANAPFADWEADVIGKCIAELESMPIVKVAGTAAAPIMPYLWLVGGFAVIGFHGYQLMSTRDKILAQWAAMQQGQNANPAAEAPSPPGP
ncbi:MAG: hypothetical protein ACRD1G_03965, partial [Acidimicrobiales bacterium]